MNNQAGRGGLSIRPVRRTVLVAGAVSVWLAMQIALVVWWATVIGRQARSIAQLQGLQGADTGVTAAQWSRTRLMLEGESTVFFALLLAVSLLLAWLYWREHRRARAMQGFFASVTHELRTPLTSIRLQAEAIVEGEHGAALAQRLLQDSHRLESQIDKTLELARIEGGGPLSEQAIPLHAWLSRTLEGIATVHGQRLQLHTDVDAALPPVQADAGALQMVLRNLIENSVRHSQVSPVSVQLAAVLRERRVVLDYRDNGRGVPPGAGRLGRLFGRGPNSGGAGVGLYLVRRLMQRMGARVRFEASGGHGFHCELSFRIADE
ncbi:MAG TPA: HAMP domain-containing sensor histidine kinase [Steroidobacteraceae bacterium]